MTNYYELYAYVTKKRCMTVEKAINWLMYDGRKPWNISQPRWDGMVKHLKREYQL
jgi:hypothetical protein